MSCCLPFFSASSSSESSRRPARLRGRGADSAGEANELRAVACCSLLNGVRVATVAVAPQPAAAGQQQLLSGEGCALADTKIVQSRSRFEVKVIKAGSFCIGIALKNINLDLQLNTQTEGVWCLSVQHDSEANKTSFSVIMPGGIQPLPVIFKANTPPPVLTAEDIITCTFDHDETAEWLLNDAPLSYATPISFKRLKGPIYAAFSVSSPTELSCNFGPLFSKRRIDPSFAHIMKETSII